MLNGLPGRRNIRRSRETVLREAKDEVGAEGHQEHAGDVVGGDKGHLDLERQRDQAHLGQAAGGVGEDQGQHPVGRDAAHGDGEEGGGGEQDRGRAERDEEHAPDRARAGADEGAADHGADHHRDDDRTEARDPLVDERGDDRDQHADGRDAVARARRAGDAAEVEDAAEAGGGHE